MAVFDSLGSRSIIIPKSNFTWHAKPKLVGDTTLARLRSLSYGVASLRLATLAKAGGPSWI